MKRVMSVLVLITMTACVSSCPSSTQKKSGATAISGENVEQVLMQTEREWSGSPEQEGRGSS
jgi:hypothetical protein